MKLISALLMTLGLIFLGSCGNGLCENTCTFAAEVGISGVSTRPNADGTMDVGISGTGFESGATVTISGVNCYDVNVPTSTYLSCTLPNQTTPIVNIIITNPGGNSNAGSGSGTNAFHTLFITSFAYFGNIGALTDADELCRQAATSGSKTSGITTGVWRAILSNSTTNARDRISFVNGASIKNAMGEEIVASASSLWGGTLSNPVKYTQNGGTVVKPTVWTGSNSNGTSVGSATNDNCGNWTLGSGAPGSPLGWGGDHRATDSTWISSSSSDCDVTASKGVLYCINSNN